MFGVDVNEVLLPGIGLRYEFTSAEGRGIGIVARREGNFDVVTYDRIDFDESRLLLRLTAEEADTVARDPRRTPDHGAVRGPDQGGARTQRRADRG
jgi:hypothetical protein